MWYFLHFHGAVLVTRTIMTMMNINLYSTVFDILGNEVIAS